MANVKISELTAASAVAAANEFEINESGTSKKVTGTQIKGFITGSDLDMGGNKVLFGNVYSALSDLPNASTYHGMFAHVHATGKGYFAHAGAWVELQNVLTSSETKVFGGGLYKGENGQTGSSAGDIFRINEQTLNTSTTIDADENANATGPLAIASGVTLTVTSGGNLSIV